MSVHHHDLKVVWHIFKTSRGGMNVIVTWFKSQFVMANYEIVEFIAIMQHLIDKITIFFQIKGDLK